jgi:hypothetical protein
MIVPVFAVFILGSVGGLMAGLYYRIVVFYMWRLKRDGGLSA